MPDGTGPPDLPPDAALAVTVLGRSGPFTDPRRASSGYVVWIDGVARLLVDAGGGTFERLARAGVDAAGLDAVLLTHTHIDHSGDLPPIVFSAFMQGRVRPLRIVGPSGRGRHPGCARFCELLFGPDGAWSYLHTFDGFGVEAVEVPEASATPQPVDVGTIAAGGPAGPGPAPAVTAVGVVHGMMPAVAFRVEHAGHSIVVSGDVEEGRPALVSLARSCDILVHDQSLPRRDMPHGHLHPPPEETGANAAAAGARALVVTHFMPPACDQLDEVVRRVAARFGGQVEVADDLRTFVSD